MSSEVIAYAVDRKRLKRYMLVKTKILLVIL